MAHRDIFPRSWRLTAEEELLLLCARAERQPSQDERLLSLIADPKTNWTLFWEMANRHEIAPLVARALSTAPYNGVLPEAATGTVRTVRFQAAGYNMAVHAELLRIGRALQERGIPAVPLKGTHLAERLYGGLDARRVGDIDVLVPEVQIEEARAVLRELSYTTVDSEHGRDHPFHGLPWIREGNSARFGVELHWMLSSPRFFPVDYERFWERVLARTTDTPLRPLPSEESLVYLAAHLAKTERGVLRLLADIDRLVRVEGPTMDWASVAEIAEAWSATWQVHACLSRSASLLGTPVPTQELERLRPPAWRNAVIELLAGPLAVLRPPTTQKLRYNKYMLAYCAALGPFSRSLDAMGYYLFQERHAQTLKLPVRAAHGLLYTGWAVGDALRQRLPNPRTA
jgi:hypothetical protein